MSKLLRIFLSERGIWHYEIERDGVTRHGSLNTRSERLARVKLARWQASIDEAEAEAEEAARG